MTKRAGGVMTLLLAGTGLLALSAWVAAAAIGADSEWSISFSIYIPATLGVAAIAGAAFVLNPWLVAVTVVVFQSVGVVLRGPGPGENDGLWGVHLVLVWIAGFPVFFTSEAARKWRLRFDSTNSADN